MSKNWKQIGTLVVAVVAVSAVSFNACISYKTRHLLEESKDLLKELKEKIHIYSGPKQRPITISGGSVDIGFSTGEEYGFPQDPFEVNSNRAEGTRIYKISYYDGDPQSATHEYYYKLNGTMPVQIEINVSKNEAGNSGSPNISIYDNAKDAPLLVKGVYLKLDKSIYKPNNDMFFGSAIYRKTVDYKIKSVDVKYISSTEPIKCYKVDWPTKTETEVTCDPTQFDPPRLKVIAIDDPLNKK